MRETNLKMIEIMQRQTCPTFIDDHTGNIEALKGLIEFINPDKALACCLNAKYYSLNECLLDSRGNLHCGTWSIGGVLNGYPTPQKLKEYNESCMFSGGRIKCIHLPNGNKILPAV